jgi:glutamine amidotransferase
MIVIIDYGIGNLRSVEKAFAFLGQEVQISDQISVIKRADLLVLPGVGAFAAGMANLNQRGFIPYIKEHIQAKRPFLGICLGFQLLFESSVENGLTQGLGVFPGQVKAFADVLDANYKIPQMGWNKLKLIQAQNPLFTNLNPETFFYFVHSYYVDTPLTNIVLAKTSYGIDYVSAISQDNLLATQFHPEKSGKAGLTLLQNFIDVQKRNGML